MKYFRFPVTIMLLIMILFSVSCGKAAQKKEPSQEGGAKEQPSDLTSLIGSIDELYENLNEIEIMQRTKESTEQGTEGGGQQGDDSQQGGQGQGGQDSQSEQSSLNSTKAIAVQGAMGGGSGGGQSGGQGQAGGGQQGQGGGQGQQEGQQQKKDKWKEDVKKLWKDIETTSETIHRNWNAYEPKTEEDNVPEEAITGFEDNLNTLTSTIREQKLVEALSAVNGLQKQVPEFTKQYKEVVPPELYEVKYYYQEVYIKSVEGSWPEATQQVEEALTVWEKAASDLEKEDEELAKKMEFSLNDLGTATQTEDINVVEAKVKVVKENYKAFEKLFEDKAKEEEKEKEKKGEKEKK